MRQWRTLTMARCGCAWTRLLPALGYIRQRFGPAWLVASILTAKTITGGSWPLSLPIWRCRRLTKAAFAATKS